MECRLPSRDLNAEPSKQAPPIPTPCPPVKDTNKDAYDLALQEGEKLRFLLCRFAHGASVSEKYSNDAATCPTGASPLPPLKPFTRRAWNSADGNLHLGSRERMCVILRPLRPCLSWHLDVGTGCKLVFDAKSWIFKVQLPQASQLFCVWGFRSFALIHSPHNKGSLMLSFTNPYRSWSMFLWNALSTEISLRVPDKLDVYTLDVPL
jgi:hypothetical protein